MKSSIPLTLLVTTLFVMSGCLDSLDNSNSGDIWGDYCAEDKSSCP